jgi:adenylate kinase
MSKKHDITIIIGLSGVGKTYLISKLLNHSSSYIHFSAGDLIRTRLANPDRDILRISNADNILENQRLFIEQLAEELVALKESAPVLLDAHVIVDNDSEVIPIPIGVFKELFPKRLIFLSDTPPNILQRREIDKSRNRPIRTIEEITVHQEKSRALVINYGQELRIPFIEIKRQIHKNNFSGELAEVLDFLKR